MSADLDEERERLATAERHIADAEKQLVELIQSAEEVRDRSGDVDTIKNAIATLDIMLIEWRTQRDLVAERVKMLEAEKS